MCNLIFENIQTGGGEHKSFIQFVIFLTFIPVPDPKVITDLRKITAVPDFTPKSPQEICERLLVTCYMGTENSSKETKDRANILAKAIGRYVSNSRNVLSYD